MKKTKLIAWIAVLIAVAAVVLYFVNQANAHEWTEADCYTPRTCTHCGETEGEPLAHKWLAASCTAPETCERCGETQGELTEHDWTKADCHAPKTCALCGLQDGNPLTHIWKVADCRTPETCILCGETQGEPMPHAWTDATCHNPQTCSLCGETQGEPLSHEWQPATCVAPETCSLCGETQGELSDHVWTDTNCAAPAPCTVCGTLDGIELTHKWRADAEICDQCGLDMRPNDEKFMDSLKLGLENRWALTAADLAAAEAAAEEEALLTGEEKKKVKMIFTPEMMKAYIQAEYDQVIGYADQPFENAELGEWAYMYIDGVIVSKQEVEALTDTTHLVDQYTRDGFHTQCVSLFHLNQFTPVTVAEEYQANLQTMLSNGEAIAKVSDLMEQVTFHNVSTMSDGRDRFEAIVTNTTGFEFETFSFDVNLFDAEDELLSSKTLAVKNWLPDEKQNFTFIAPRGAHKIQLTFANWMFPGGTTADTQNETAEESVEEPATESVAAEEVTE